MLFSELSASSRLLDLTDLSSCCFIKWGAVVPADWPAPLARAPVLVFLQTWFKSLIIVSSGVCCGGFVGRAVRKKKAASLEVFFYSVL